MTKLLDLFLLFKLTNLGYYFGYWIWSLLWVPFLSDYLSVEKLCFVWFLVVSLYLWDCVDHYIEYSFVTISFYILCPKLIRELYWDSVFFAAKKSFVSDWTERSSNCDQPIKLPLFCFYYKLRFAKGGFTLAYFFISCAELSFWTCKKLLRIVPVGGLAHFLPK